MMGLMRESDPSIRSGGGATQRRDELALRADDAWPTAISVAEGQLAAAIVATVRSPLLILDAGLLVHRANLAFYRDFRVEPEETIGRRIFEIGDGQWDVPALRSLLEEIILRDTAFDDFEVQHDFPRLGRRAMLLTARRIEGGLGHPLLILLAIEDDTERRESKGRADAYAAELQRSNRELEELASVASHDLQEPLRKIRTFGELLAEECDLSLGETGRAYLGRMRHAAERMQALIDDLLTFARVAARPKPLQPVDLGQIAREALGDLESQVARLDARVTVGELPTVDGNPTQMRQLLQNLLGNALKFHRAGVPPAVWIFDPDAGIRPHAEAARRFAVRDEGIGFEPIYAEKIFGLFERLHGRSTYEGTGVGLALCRRIVERHGGTIEATSSLGQGTTFIVALPAHGMRMGAEDA
jgi:signal transduction histidine kinase